nr:MAG TPA: hypothetical protein [Caudoviricetes sp.]
MKNWQQFLDYQPMYQLYLYYFLILIQLNCQRYYS